MEPTFDPMPAIRLEAPPRPHGTLDSPLGLAPLALHAPRFLQGLRCGCGRTLVVYASAVESDEPLACPHCQSSLR